MCPWCFLTPACPCRHGGGPPSLTLGKALVAVARRVGAVRLGFGALLLAMAVIALGGCGGDDDEGGGDVRLAELRSHLPAAGDLGMKEQRKSEWHDATDLLVPTDLLVQGLVIPQATTPSKLGAAIEDAGFQGAVGSELADSHHKLNVRISAAQFDSEEGALEARNVLHQEDLNQPCRAACTVAPREYELDEIPDSAAVHHAPVRGKLPPGLSRVEAYHAEFVIGPQLYVLQEDGPPSSTFGAEFDRVVQTVYKAASSS
jgi:hypothetical protein